MNAYRDRFDNDIWAVEVVLEDVDVFQDLDMIRRVLSAWVIGNVIDEIADVSAREDLLS
jgi:hypothetical protein